MVQFRHALLMLAFFSQILFAGNGLIRGQISDENGLPLAGANVFIENLKIGATSDRSGEFTLGNVPEGQHELQVSYIGYLKDQKAIQVQSDQTAAVLFQLKSGVLSGNEILVIGDRLKGQAKSLNVQKTNPNISNVISADQMGRFPDANIGDALKRVPAITVNYDQGEARFINIRGTEPRLNSVMINGERIPSAEGEIRAVQVDLIPADMIQTIEVSKAVTPDMEADAIGGTINLVTRSAPHGMRISGTLGSGYNMISSKPQMTGSLVLGNRFLNDRIGLVLSGSYFNNPLGSHNTEGEWDTADDGSVYAKEWDIRKYDVQRVRRSFSGALDFKLSTEHTLYLRGMYNHRDDWENRFRLRYKLDEPNAEGVSEETEVRFQTKGGIGNDRLDNCRLEDQRTYNFSLSGQHLFGSFAKADWNASYSKASEERPNERYISWRVKDIPVHVDLNNLETPYFSAVNSSDIALDNLSLKEITEEHQYTDEIDQNFQLNLEIPILKDGLYKNNVKIGARYKNKNKERDNKFYEYEPLNDDFEHMGLVETKDFSDDNFLAGDYNIGRLTTPEFLGGLDLDNAALFEKSDVPAEYAAANYTANEKITAGYAMINQHVGDNLLIIAGVRMENTEIDYTGYEYNESNDEVSERSGKDSYNNLLPGLHLKYALNANTILRAAWTNTISRPNYYHLVPFRAINDDQDEIEVGNPELKPTTSLNFDLMAEKYFESIGILSAGLFYKNINDFIYVDDISTDENVEIYKPLNGAKATLFGIEFAAQRRLDFLPGLFRNLDVYANYTFTASTTDNPAFGDKDIDLPGTAPHTLNAALNYQIENLVMGISFNYTSPYLDSDGIDLTEGLERYYDEVTYLDFNASYKIMPQLRIYFEGNNLLNQPLRYYAGDQSRTYQAEYYDRRFSAGVKFNL